MPEDLNITKPNTDVIVYKMHGDIDNAYDAVITKEDYELYETKRELYSQALKGDLVSKTFLFIGFSFDDPNLSYILSRVRTMVGENGRLHYCFMRKVNKDDPKYKGKDEKEFIYDEVKQDLKIKDLKRYNIHVLLVDKYEEITEILQNIAYLVNYKNVFVSGSATDFGE